MKILQILPELNVGGVETGTVDLAKYLVQHGHEAIVVSNGGGLVDDLMKVGARHYKLPVHRKSLWTIAKCIGELEKIIQQEKVDIVHARSRVPAWIAYFACRRTKTAFITTCHGYYGNHFFSRVMGLAKLVIVPSEVIGRHMVEDFGALPENIRRIPRSVDLEKYRISRAEKSSSEYVISIIGRITPLKGHTYFLRAMAKVIRSMPYVKIWIIGDAPKKKQSYKEELELLIKRLGLSDYVEFLGNRRDVPQLLAQTDVVVLSTITEEAFGRVILEAQAMGVPVVATRVGGVIEIIEHEKTGLLVFPKDTDAMANAVFRLLRDKNLVESLTSAAKAKLEREFTLEKMASQTLAVYEELLKMMHILVIKISSLGDVVLVIPSLRALRQQYPHAKICCVVGKEFRMILQRCPYIDDLIVYDYKGKDKGWIGLWKLARKLRSYKFDMVVDFQNNKKSHLLAFLCRPLDSYGYDNKKWSFFLTKKLEDDKSAISPVDHQFRLLRQLKIANPQDPSLEFWLSPRTPERVQKLLESEWLANAKRIVGINVSASEEWTTKNWPVSYMAELCDRLGERGIRVILTGMEKDRPLIQELMKQTKAKPASFAGKTTIMELAGLIQRCQVYITPDSAPMHLAAALKIPFIAFFGPTDPKRHLPPAQKCAVLQRPLECVPCYKTYCRISTHACMREITPSMVLQEIDKFLREEEP